jgi:ligand-binding sensor domain-containing protein/signal transduction histidine kinase
MVRAEPRDPIYRRPHRIPKFIGLCVRGCLTYRVSYLDREITEVLFHGRWALRRKVPHSEEPQSPLRDFRNYTMVGPPPCGRAPVPGAECSSRLPDPKTRLPLHESGSSPMASAVRLARTTAALTATLATLVPPCRAAAQPSAASAQPGPLIVTIDPHIVRLPVVEGHGIRFVRLRRSMGLSQQRVVHIGQDPQGYLWFGTQYGLDRYDGYRFKVFKNDSDDPSSMCGANVDSLLIDRSGRLWVGCSYVFDRYDPTTETFVHYRLAPPNVTGVGGIPRNISEDDAGILWLSTMEGLYRFDPKTGATARFVHEKDDPFSLSSSDVMSTGEDREGTFWVATRAGLDAFDRKTDRVTEHVPLSESSGLSFYEDRQGTFWVLYASGNGLAVLDRKRHLLTRYSFGREDLSTHPLTGVSSMLEDRDGNLWIGTFSDGLLKFDRKHRRFVRYSYNPSNADSLPENRITTLFQDREGDIWLGFGTSAPAFFPMKAPPFSPLPFDSNDPANLGEREVDAIYQDRAGILWLGTTGALVRIDRQTGKLTHFAIPGRGVASDVLALTEDSSGALWIGTSGQGLYRRSASNGRLTAFRHRDGDPYSLSADTVFQVLVDRTGTLWVATDDGLDRFNAAKNTFTTFRFAAKGQVNRIQRMTEDPGGLLWVATGYFGVLSFDPRTGLFKQLSTTRQLNLEGRPGINSLMIDSAGNLWAATQNGLDRYNRQTGLIAHYSEKDGLASNAVSCLLEDSAGALWASTSSGLSRLDRARKVFTNYSEADGLPGPDLSGYYGVCFRSPSGEMFFGGFSGAVALRPDRLSDAAYAPPVVLTSFQLFGKSVRLGSGSPLRRVINDTHRLTLSHDQNSFSFEFSALSFQNPSTNRYRFKLEGLDKGWQEVGSDHRYATYTTLPPGKYRFRVQGATIRGPWGKPGASVRITINPAWWATEWFYTVATLLVAAAFATLYRFRVARVREDIRRVLEARLSERERIARELHDTLLQGVQGLIWRFQAAADRIPREEPARQMMEQSLERADKLLGESRDRVKDLRPLASSVVALAQAVATEGSQLAQLHAAEFRVSVQGAPRNLHPIVREEGFLIAREALGNAFQHSGAKNIEAEVTYGDDAFHVRVRDDGQGIGSSVLQAAGKPGHFGLIGMRERAAKIGGHLEVWSKPDAGTEVDLRVPAHLAYRQASSSPSLVRWLLTIFRFSAPPH